MTMVVDLVQLSSINVCTPTTVNINNKPMKFYF